MVVNGGRLILGFWLRWSMVDFRRWWWCDFDSVSVLLVVVVAAIMGCGFCYCISFFLVILICCIYYFN